MLTLRVLLVLAAVSLAGRPAMAQTVTCDLTIGSYGTGGTCTSDGVAEGGARRGLAFLWPPDSVRVELSGRPSDDPPWRGVLLLSDTLHNEVTVPFEIDREQPGTAHERLVLRNGWSWVVVHEWRELGSGAGWPFGRAEALLSFDLADYPLAGPDDIAIFESALAHLDTLAVWGRDDDQDCANDPPGHASLFCMLASAVWTRMGRYHHRQPALQLVRALINDRWPDRWEYHPLMDFNNHANTTLDDIRAALQEALALAEAEAARTR